MIPEEHIHNIRALVLQQYGWDFLQSREKDLERGIMTVAAEAGFGRSKENICNWLNQTEWNPENLERLARHLTIGETYFFREKPHLDLFSNTIIPELIRERQGKNQSLKIWSAGCSTGEEPYTLAMILRSTIPDIQTWNICIIGSDMNPDYLERAKAARYGNWSFRNTPSHLMDLCFRKSGTHWELIQEIRQMVIFTRLNLASDDYPSHNGLIHNVDVIFCRNVLMYFSQPQIRHTTHRFYKSLNSAGWLLPSAVELNDSLYPDFIPVNTDNCIVYRKLPHYKQRKLPAFKTPLPISDPGFAPPEKARRLQLHQTGSIRTRQNDARVSEKPDTEETARGFFEAGNYKTCLEHALKLYKEGIRTTGLMELIVRSYANIGQLQEACDWGTTMLSMEGIHAAQHYLVANIMMEMNDRDQAERILKRGLYLDPHHLLSHYLLGTILMKPATVKSGRKHLQNALELLQNLDDESVVPDTGGMTAGRIREMISNLSQRLRND